MFSPKRLFKQTLGLLSLAGALTLSRVNAYGQTQTEKPNFLFIFADDLTYEGIRSLGDLKIKTPNLDKLVKEGTTFTHTYNMGAWNGAVCMASRAMINTGMYVWKTQDHMNEFRKNPQVKESHPFWSEMMSNAGYETYFTGKWHVGVKPQQIFDNVTDVRGGMPNQTKEGYNRPLSEDDKNWLPWDKTKNGFWKGGQHWTEKLGDTGVRYIEQASNKDKPFFMYLAFNAAHDPRQAPKEYVDMYPLKKIKTPKNFMADYPDFKTLFPKGNMRDERLAPFPRTEYSVKVNRQEYYALITYMDEQIGRILDALEKSGKADNTYIVFTADHGLSVGHHGLLGKQNMYDHSIRVPFMVVGPNVPKNRKIKTPIYLQAVMPTALEVAGVQQPSYVDFKSVLPVIRGERKSNLEAVYGGFMAQQRCVIQDNYKLILYPKSGVVKLFNMKKDANEMKNLAEKPEHKARIKQMFEKLKDLQKENGDKLDLDQAYPALASANI
ncbi:choline-sulfatase [Fulvitalea axinellae]|uniref:Choline-sulfatase n=1 Tax=Fulvitalea axinellae TaxID=1182444 RepID=A0AAU9CGR3_9BACT|nr:choline-sulfatase [Fulvitalea axinellae]